MNHAGSTSADQPDTPPNRSTAARQRDFAQQRKDLRDSADQLQSDLATSAPELAQTPVNEATQGHKTLTVRTAPLSDPSHLQALITALADYCQKLHMQVSIAKTKVMIIGDDT